MDKPKLPELHRTQISEKFFKNKYLEYRDFLYTKYRGLPWHEMLYLDYHNIDRPVCPICGKPALFISVFKGYRKYCSNICSKVDAKNIVKKSRQTMLDKYGSEHALQIKSVKQKFEQTCIDKYGVKNPTQNQSISDRAKQTTILRYGALGSASPILKQRQQTAIRKKRLEHNIITQQIGYTDDGKWILSCDKGCPGCDGTFVIKSGNYLDRKRIGYPLCTKLYPVTPKPTKNTSIEIFIRDILDRYNIKYITNDRSILTPKEVDIYCPDYKIAIECNGCYWHSDNVKESDYHLSKFETCEVQGIQLLQIWEDWYHTKPQIVESMLLSKFGIYKQRIGARQCQIRQVTKNHNQFFIQNHIQGASKSKVVYGLYYNDQCVAMMAFNKRSKWSNDDCWELVRFCPLLKWQVIGGADRLLKHFISQYNPTKIVSFSANDISSGALYKRLGFQKFSRSRAYWYVQQGTFKRFHRTSFCKARLKQMGMDVSKTEREIMSELPYWRIYDSGTTGWQLLL